MTKVKRYQMTKEQLERVVESYTKEKANISEESKKKVTTKEPNGDDKNQAPEAKKHVKGSVEGGNKMVTKRTNSPAAKKKDWGRNDEKSQAPEAKKHVKKGTVKESEEMTDDVMSENVVMDVLNSIYDALGGHTPVSVGGETIEKGMATLAMIGTLLGIGGLAAGVWGVPQKMYKWALSKFKGKPEFEKAQMAFNKLSPDDKKKLASELSKGVNKEELKDSMNKAGGNQG